MHGYISSSHVCFRSMYECVTSGCMLDVDTSPRPMHASVVCMSVLVLRRGVCSIDHVMKARLFGGGLGGKAFS